MQATHFMVHNWVMEVQLSSSSSSINNKCGQLKWFAIDHAVLLFHTQSGKMEEMTPLLSFHAHSLLVPYYHLLWRCSDLGTPPPNSSCLQFHRAPHWRRIRDSSNTTTTLAIMMRVIRCCIQMLHLSCISCSAMLRTCSATLGWISGLVYFFDSFKGPRNCTSWRWYLNWAFAFVTFFTTLVVVPPYPDEYRSPPLYKRKTSPGEEIVGMENDKGKKSKPLLNSAQQTAYLLSFWGLISVPFLDFSFFPDMYVLHLELVRK